jgi:hypothetical protein
VFLKKKKKRRVAKAINQMKWDEDYL